jgi:hypothetical protein
MTMTSPIPLRFSRLAATCTFRNDALSRWLQANVFIVGAGNLGRRVAMECLLAGAASVTVCDFARAKEENRGTQFGGAPGTGKVDDIVAWAAKSAAGRAIGIFSDVRHVGIGQFVGVQLLVDCTDDPRLAVPLTTISNGLGIPLLRAALDGSGEVEMGRVACYHGGAGYACQLCTWEVRDLFRHTQRTPCQPDRSAARPPTLAGGAIGATIAGMTVLQAQRLVTGNDAKDVLDREWIVDLSNGQLLTVTRKRSANCFSGHVRWKPDQLPHLAAQTTWSNLLAIAQQRCGSRDIELEPFGHALCLELACPSGHRRHAVGTRWATTPNCDRCGATMQWQRETCRSRITPPDIDQLQLADQWLAATGLPDRGAMIVARTPDKPPLRLLLA